MEIPDKPGVYCVVYHLPKMIYQTIGMLGKEEFLPGIYFYCGSAKGRSGLRGRVSRHLRNGTKRHWHIDHIKNHFEPLRVWFVTDINMSECVLVRILEEMEDIIPIIRGFGASDCRQHCLSHLLLSRENIDLDQLFNKITRSLSGIKQVGARSNRLIR